MVGVCRPEPLGSLTATMFSVLSCAATRPKFTSNGGPHSSAQDRVHGRVHAQCIVCELRQARSHCRQRASLLRGRCCCFPDHLRDVASGLGCARPLQHD
eukprot:7453134-Alexandrium_andersonii.AAC.1